MGNEKVPIVSLTSVIVVVIVLMAMVTASVLGQQAKVSVNVPEGVLGVFDATIDIVNVADLGAGQFDLVVDSSEIKATDVKAEGVVISTPLAVGVLVFLVALPLLYLLVAARRRK